MSEKIDPVTYDEYLWILTTAQKYHIDQGEPIPEIERGQEKMIRHCLESPFGGVENEEFYNTFDKKSAVLLSNRQETLYK